jgi:hypothetical protein
MRFTKKWQSLYRLREILDTLPDGEYSIKPYSPPRNLDQNAIYHALLTLVERESGNDKDDMHELMKLKYNRKRIKSNLWGKKSWKYVGGSTKELNRKQFSEYFSHVERFFAELGYVLPPRDSPEFQSLISNYE